MNFLKQIKYIFVKKRFYKINKFYIDIIGYRYNLYESMIYYLIFPFSGNKDLFVLRTCLFYQIISKKIFFVMKNQKKETKKLNIHKNNIILYVENNKNTGLTFAFLMNDFR